MNEQHIRTQMMLGEEGTERLFAAKIAVFGVGGVGGFVVETLARSNVGYITVVDGDVVSESNVNRQIIALSSTIGKPKTQVIAQRVYDINPHCVITEINEFYKGEGIDFSQYDFVVDCIDDVDAKLAIIGDCAKLDVPVISSMGTANHFDPYSFKIADLYETNTCPLAKRVRSLAQKKGIEKGKVNVLFSTEKRASNEFNDNGRILGSTAFCPSIAGILIAHHVVSVLARLGE